jgi:hypothetical protein
VKVWADYARNNVVFIDEVNEAARGPHRLNDVARGAIILEHSRYVDSIRRYLNEDQIYDIERNLKALRKGIFSMGETPVLERISLHTAAFSALRKGIEAIIEEHRRKKRDSAERARVKKSEKTAMVDDVIWRHASEHWKHQPSFRNNPNGTATKILDKVNAELAKRRAHGDLPTGRPATINSIGKRLRILPTVHSAI